jgi:hypothetical protein
VRCYEDFVEYLRAKSPDIQSAYLPFTGRNIVLYRIVEEEFHAVKNVEEATIVQVDNSTSVESENILESDNLFEAFERLGV